MPYSVNSCFDVFMRDFVNLNPERTTTARASRDWLVHKIEELSNSERIPPLYNGANHIFFGSFARNTKIRPLDDIDIMIMFDAQGCTTDDVAKKIRKTYPIYVNNPDAKLLSDYCDGNILNSRRMIEAIKKELGNIPRYSKAEIHRNQEAVTLQLSSYEWNFDILPATRLMKYWKKEHWGNEVISYLFENFMIDWVNNLTIFPSTYPQLVKRALEVLSSKIMMDYNDPKGFQGNINNLDIHARSRLAIMASQDASEARAAIQYEQNYMTEAAINKWIKIFGNEFPRYGK